MTKTVLLGTTNPAKIKRFEELLRGYAVQFYTLSDLHIEKEPRETGTTPRENAELKAKFYGQYFDLVLCSDSGLYFDGLPLEDPLLHNPCSLAGRQSAGLLFGWRRCLPAGENLLAYGSERGCEAARFLYGGFPCQGTASGLAAGFSFPGLQNAAVLCGKKN